MQKQYTCVVYYISKIQELEWNISDEYCCSMCGSVGILFFYNYYAVLPLVKCKYLNIVYIVNTANFIYNIMSEFLLQRKTLLKYTYPSLQILFLKSVIKLIVKIKVKN